MGSDVSFPCKANMYILKKGNFNLLQQHVKGRGGVGERRQEREK